MQANQVSVPQQQPIIKVDNLVKRYKRAERNAVDGISFTVAQGSLFALLGPNGAGKTTTISILTTTLTPTAGTAIVAGNDIARNARIVRNNIGIIFQKPSLDLNLTAEENVRFHAMLYGLYSFRPAFSLMPATYQKQVYELSTLLGIEGELFKPVKKFSGGMKRKLEILRSLLHQPKVLFLDEPTSGLDPASRRSLWEYLRRVRAESGTTVFLTTHYLEEAEEADSICIINHGKIVSYGTPAEVKAELVEEYVLLGADDLQQLRTELNVLQVPFKDFIDNTRQHQNALLQVQPKERSIHQLLKAPKHQTHPTQTHTPTLEDVYLEIVGRS